MGFDNGHTYPQNRVDEFNAKLLHRIDGVATTEIEF